MLKVHLDAFKQTKEMIMTEAKLVFPDFAKPFHLYTDASDIQMLPWFKMGSHLDSIRESLTKHNVVTLWERKSYLGLSKVSMLSLE